MEAFVGPCPKGKEVNHKDGKLDNNRRTNLEYITHKRNMLHAVHTLGSVTPPLNKYLRNKNEHNMLKTV